MSLCLMSTFIREVPGYTSLYVVIGVSTLATIAQTNLACKIQTPTYYICKTDSSLSAYSTSTNQYMGFGLSGSTSRTLMFGADPTIAWVDEMDGPQAVDYYLSAYTQVGTWNSNDHVSREIVDYSMTRPEI